MTVEEPKPKQLLRQITTGAGSALSQLQLSVTRSNLFGFGYNSHWLKNWRESFKPITKCRNCNHVITFDSHLKTVLS